MGHWGGLRVCIPIMTEGGIFKLLTTINTSPYIVFPRENRGLTV